MELHQIAYFSEVARTGNFSRAAENRHVSQPTLSQQIRKLEDELGGALFVRSRSGARLTALGETFRPRAQRILAEVAAAHDDAHAFSSLARGTLRLGAIPTIAPYLLPTLVEAVTEAFPGFQLLLREETTETLIQLLHDGELDLGLASPPFQENLPLSADTLFEDELLVALPAEHALSAKPILTLEDIATCPLILMKDTHCLSRQTRSFCQQHGFEPQVAIHSSQLDTTVALVASGLGLSIIPDMARHAFQHRAVTFASVNPGRLFRSICLIRARHQVPTKAQLAFIRLCKEVTRQPVSPPS